MVKISHPKYRMCTPFQLTITKDFEYHSYSICRVNNIIKALELTFIA